MPKMCAIPQLVSAPLNPIPIVYNILGIPFCSQAAVNSLLEKPGYDSKLNTSLELLEINHKMK